MRNAVCCLLVASLLLVSSSALADSCYSNSQCPEGTICWGGECRSELGRNPSPSNGGGEPNWLFIGLGVVVCAGIAYFILIHSPTPSYVVGPQPGLQFDLRTRSHPGLGFAISF